MLGVLLIVLCMTKVSTVTCMAKTVAYMAITVTFVTNTVITYMHDKDKHVQCHPGWLCRTKTVNIDECATRKVILS